jgi:CDP-glucose 4,6-dehydratase
MAKIMNLTFYKNKKIFITGHTGFKGTWLCLVLLFAGAKVVGYALMPKKQSLYNQTSLDKNIDPIIGDVRDREKLALAVRKAQPDLVFHLAAQPLVRYSYQNPTETYETNVLGAVNTLEAVRQTASIKSFVNITTDKVYANQEREKGYTEDEKLGGFDPYSSSKSCGDLITSSYRNSFFTDKNSAAISTARSGNVIGGGDFAADRIIPDCIRAVTAKNKIIVRNPDSIRPYQHVLDCLSGYLLLAQKQYEHKKFEGAYNFGPDVSGCVTTGQLADLFCAAWGGSTVWQAQPERQAPHEANFLKLDCAKARTILGWRPVWNIKTAIQKTVEFAKSSADQERLTCVERQISEYFGGEK